MHCPKYVESSNIAPQHIFMLSNLLNSRIFVHSSTDGVRINRNRRPILCASERFGNKGVGRLFPCNSFSVIWLYENAGLEDNDMS